jgi:hypothetical protein
LSLIEIHCSGADSVKSNPLAELFANEGSLDSDSLKASRIYFERDFDGYIDNLLWVKLITAGN